LRLGPKDWLRQSSGKFQQPVMVSDHQDAQQPSIVPAFGNRYFVASFTYSFVSFGMQAPQQAEEVYYRWLVSL